MNYACALIIFVFLFMSILYFCNKGNKINVKNRHFEEKGMRRLIVISFYKLTSSQKMRWVNVGKKLSIGYKIVFVTENCNYIQELKPFDVFCFTRNDFIREFPQYKTMGGICQNQHPGFYMWSMWLESVLHSINNIYRLYKFIWIIEGDVGYSGDINMFFKKYDSIYSDLISLPILVANSTKDWCWYECYTKEYKEWIKSIAPVERLIAAINIIRLSPKIIDTVISNLKLNKHSHCESTLLETAKYNNLITIYFNRSDLGEKIGVGDRVSVNDWKICNTDTLKQNKLYHALKF